MIIKSLIWYKEPDCATNIILNQVLGFRKNKIHLKRRVGFYFVD